MTTPEWISVTEAAYLLGYSPDYFRRTFCVEPRPLILIRSWTGPTGQRRIMVSQDAVMNLLNGQLRPPA